MKILVVEDDKELNQFIRAALKREGFCAEGAADGKTALRMAVDGVYDAILLDVMLPELSGLAVLKELRRTATPSAIILLTSQGQDRDRVSGLNLGADDYIVKPFLITELVARIRAVVRRGRHNEGQARAMFLAAGGLRLNLIKHELEVKGQPVKLTKKEFELLECFMRHPGEVLSKSSLEARVWNMEFTPGSNVVEVQINHLRAKINHGKKPLLVTVRGVGYRFEP